ncbi:LacI family DNA-binding transcriptional regulator [Rahnella victoriana]|uniref:LacI family DNA-binding transcriptional regulator n=1 Tax=Rahnella victoriana TaxID=1510570 RepID=A0ABS0DUM2_9GAMM|nr:LacI family DNA-binding transcriptional regulator [Rahnella victoriana]MBF7955838.1 LacI family DNA-binding transcriptional regulator [Rahnella victoriana]TBX30661.1 LacI family transcriptional regulator [Rahnella victoriana]
MEKKNKVTMSDIAREAGVSQATVSLILNNSRSVKLSEETRQRVFSTALSLGYKKMPAPHSDNGQEEIALLINAMPSYDPFVDALSEAREAAWKHNTLLTVYDYGDDAELAVRIIAQLNQRRCAGIILASPVTQAIDYAPFANQTQLPVVLLNVYDRAFPLLPTFLPDDRANALQITRHLIDQGATRIAHIMGDNWMEACEMRLEGYREALSQAGMAHDDQRVLATNWSLNETYRATLELMKLPEPPDAIFCSSDWMTIGCYQALTELHLRIPQDILVAGYDDQRIADQMTPKLTSVQLPYFELGRMAVEYLCSGEDAATRVIMAGKLKVRASTAAK